MRTIESSIVNFIRVELLTHDGEFYIRSDNGRDVLTLIEMGENENIARAVFRSEVDHQHNMGR